MQKERVELYLKSFLCRHHHQKEPTPLTYDGFVFFPVAKYAIISLPFTIVSASDGATEAESPILLVVRGCVLILR